ncbi:hypothetical protein Pla110_18250 [Polystyrenella longa]|uniref:Uncharacterized protein n=1 Tax=Polystyrenella longa TaxID=2528007 RepID=A0A518CLM0_9PLAN|nr:hypothetical protein Pla110_18250 [Polystyrenella longa]
MSNQSHLIIIVDHEHNYLRSLVFNMAEYFYDTGLKESTDAGGDLKTALVCVTIRKDG